MKKKLWNQSHARASLLGRETDTMNPSIAARSLLGEFRVRQAQKVKRRSGFLRKFHKNNPTLASIGSLVPGGGLIGGILSGLGGRFNKPSEVRAAALAPAIVQAANAGNLTAARGLIERAARPMKVAESAVWKAAAAQLSAATVAAVHKHIASIPQADQSNPENFAHSVLSSAVQLPTAGAAPGNAFTQLAATPGVAQLAGKIVTQATRRPRARRGYPAYTDRYGRQRYSTKPPGTQLRLPVGASPIAGTPFNFFRSAVGSGGAAATAGQLAVAAGAGLAAYLVTQKLLEHFGGGAQKAEEAGVSASLAHHEAILEFKKQKGRNPNAAELAEMKSALRDKLVELGYDPVTFNRTRSGVENFLETYNPFGG